MNYAPIALFTYNRPDHTQQAVESLLTNAEAKYSDLYIFSDGPKNDKAVEGVKANREYIRSLKAANDNVNDNVNGNGNVNGNVNSSSLNREGRGGFFRSITIIERDKNWGLANSLIAGITEVINKHGRVIVVEDDLVLSPFFLQYMNEALEKYKDEDKVGAITAYCPIKDNTLPESYFLRYFHCWGWATWKRGWDLMNLDTKYLLRKLRWKTKKFNLDGGINNYGMLYCQKVGLVDSWFIRLYASFFLAEKLTLFPGHSLVSNHGLDGSGTHCGKPSKDSGDDGVGADILSTPIRLSDITIQDDERAYRQISDTLLAQHPKAKFLRRKYGWFKSFVRRLLYIDCA